MTRRRPDARRWQRRAAAWVAATVLASGATAQTVSDPQEPVGFKAGPVVLAPSLTTEYGYDSNVFMRSDEFGPAPVPDQVLTLKPALLLTIPFSNSALRFGDTLSWVDYKETPQIAGKTSNDAMADLTLRFGSLDTLALSARHVNGVSETTEFDPGGEVSFRGIPYRLHTEMLSVSREVAGARGYRFSVSRNALDFDNSIEVFFFDYRGFDGDASYVQPLSPNTRLAFGYVGTRYDHFGVGTSPSEVGRTENGNTLYAQVEGRLGPKQPYRLRLGWESLAFEGNSAKDFSGVVGDAAVSAIVGGGTTFTLTAQRQPYRSFFGTNNFYVFESVGGRVERPFQSGTSVGGDVSFSRNTYGEPVAGILREDHTFWIEAYANLAVRERVVFRLSVLKRRRYSNTPGADFNITAVFGGFVFGWI
jgi:hypothetical protein